MTPLFNFELLFGANQVCLKQMSFFWFGWFLFVLYQTHAESLDAQLGRGRIELTLGKSALWRQETSQEAGQQADAREGAGGPDGTDKWEMRWSPRGGRDSGPQAGALMENSVSHLYSFPVCPFYYFSHQMCRVRPHNKQVSGTRAMCPLI